MDAKFHALTLDEALDIGPTVRSNTDVDAYDLLDSNYFGNDYSSSSIEQSLSDMHTRKVIMLSAPTFNHVLGRSNGALLQKMLNVKKDLWDNIVSMKVVLDLDSLEFIKTDFAYDGGEYLYGAEIAEYLIEKMDIDEEILNCLYECFDNFLKMGSNSRDFITIDKNENSGMKLAGGYYAHFEMKDLTPNLKRGYSADSLEKDYKNKLLITRWRVPKPSSSAVPRRSPRRSWMPASACSGSTMPMPPS